MTARREKSERHRRLNYTQPGELPPAWIHPSRRALFNQAHSPWRRLLVAVALVGLVALASVFWPGAFP